MTYNSSGSTWESTNEAGDLTGFWGYDAFGTLAFGTPTSPFGYGGQYTDATTGFGVDHRRLNSETATFTTRDPAFPATDTAYTYAGDDPIDAGDPTGDVAQPCSLLADPQANWSTNQVNPYLLKGSANFAGYGYYIGALGPDSLVEIGSVNLRFTLHLNGRHVDVSRSNRSGFRSADSVRPSMAVLAIKDWLTVPRSKRPRDF